MQGRKAQRVYPGSAIGKARPKRGEPEGSAGGFRENSLGSMFRRVFERGLGAVARVAAFFHAGGRGAIRPLSSGSTWSSRSAGR